MQDVVIAPSILSADLARIGEEVSSVLSAGADWIHFDVMDNHFVPNLTFGSDFCGALRNYGITAPIDVHLMINPVDSLIPKFAKAGASSISFHPEATNNLEKSIQSIRDNGCKAGLAFNPATSLDYFNSVKDKLDYILLMTVNPGFSGQKFIEGGVERIAQARQMLDSLNSPIRLEVDGGVNLGNIAKLANAGADTFVAGSAIFNNKDYASTIRKFRDAISNSNNL